VAATALIAGAAHAQSDQTPSAPPAAAPAAPVVSNTDVISTLQSRGNFTTFLKLMDAAKITAPIKGLPNVTIFAPTDAAFAQLAPGIVDNWMKPENSQSLQKLLLNHVFNGPIPSAQVIDHKGEVQSAAGSPLQLDGTGGTFKVNNATATLPETKATNGYVYTIDKVLNLR
jgi:uncharacterized surface protein with fasciclin (FAS1) repeats